MAKRPTATASAPTPAVAPPMPWLQPQLQALLRQSGHALLLEGPSGLGQFELGLAWAQAVLCEAQPVGNGAALQPACGQCESCHAMTVHTHPDLLVLLPEALQLQWGWATPEAEGDAKRKPSREIRVEAMRQMITFSQRTDARGRGKVVLVYPAENMNLVTANALLKTLEEPPGNTRFVLASQAAHRLLPTIRSRCHAWKMQWPATEQVQQWLAASGAAPQQIEAALAAAGGRPQDALALLQAGFDAQQWLALPGQLAQGRPGWLAEATPSQAIAVLQQICHDAMALVAGAAPRYFSRAALAACLPGWAAAGPQAGAAEASAAAAQRQRAFERLGRWSAELTQAARTSEHPYAQELMLAALVEQARSALNLRA
ncbi:DNA polymerase III subunit delta' [Vandammella animalimorsus]|uniref:DNA polymerase III subunit delta n=1 Tax=Vandammella animalimorsus TaxID=2029117 RepID=A0A2A2A885_9BURK|nr:DNA polymerase III subunit delta' [Vandammella animalimorsus]PAT33977.1 DNA polymerase III subunit delta' [Vandammella animalimorsus]